MRDANVTGEREARRVIQELSEGDMCGIADYRPTASQVRGSSAPNLPLIDAHSYAAIPPWGYATAATLGLAVVLLIGAPRTDLEDTAYLERLAPAIERAPALSAEARAAIERVVTRQAAADGADDEPHAARRKLAIERITRAMHAKDANTTGVNGMDERPTAVSADLAP
jgi:hypothetical protein